MSDGLDKFAIAEAFNTSNDSEIEYATYAPHRALICVK